MKTTRVVWAGLVFILALVFVLRGQTTESPVSTGTVSLSVADIKAVATLSDTELAALLRLLAATPMIAADDLPRGGMGGNYFSLAHPEWPPLPGAVQRVPVWELTSEWGGNCYLLNDLNLVSGTVLSGGMMMAIKAASPPVPGEGGTNGEGGGFVYNFQPPVYTTNDLWLQMAGVTNTGMSRTVGLLIHPPWSVSNGVYDLFATTNLGPGAWQWGMRCAPGQTNLTAPNLTGVMEYFILGVTNDADGDCLADAFETLVSHTSPNEFNFSIDGYGTPNAWYVAQGVNPQTSNVGAQDPDGDGLSNAQEYQYGTQPLISEGFGVWVSAPNGFSSIP